MTLKEELEILRGEPIEVFEGDPMDIPCIETSDPEKLCKNPVVSVHMITYNHEPYIRQAIEGVMMQKTDFEFELVIGEDCSQDKTREICFEYQKKYPDKIRVLWWHDNVSKLGGNGRRTRAHCRGEFIAFCEGDDYWIDSLKLQRQVDVMRAHPNVGTCFARVDVLFQRDGRYCKYDNASAYKGLMSHAKFSYWNCVDRYAQWNKNLNQRLTETSGVLIRRTAYHVGVKKFSEIVKWRLMFGDTLLFQLAATSADVYFLPETVSVYRINSGGVSQNRKAEIMIDATCVFSVYFLVKQFNYSISDAVKKSRQGIFEAWMLCVETRGYKKLGKIFKSRHLLTIFCSAEYVLDFLMLLFHVRTDIVKKVTLKYRRCVGKLAKLGCLSCL